MRIKRLPQDLINKIAAGEVIERPSSVLKELIENSLDAQADRIEIKIEKGGKKLIEVKDNGIGIHPDDILEAVNRYSTSKISDIDELFYINSYGFRGEALSSISSVSKFSLISKPEEFTLGKEIYIEGGVFKHLSDTGAPKGTTVRVRDLFFNVPVRQKFLKSEKTELSHIQEVFIKYAIYHNSIQFILDVDSKKQFILNPEDRKSRIKNIFSKAENILEFEYENYTGKAYGYILPDYQNGKGYIYINGRPVKNGILQKIIKSKTGKNMFIVFLELPPYMVDHNIHPSKIEVKFRKEKPVYDLVKDALETIQKPDIKISLAQPKAKYNSEFKILGQIENTFIVVYYDGDIYFIDQHVASERINYELLLKRYNLRGIEKHKIDSIQLSLEEKQIDKLKEISDILERAGFSFEFTKNTVKITAAPINGKKLKTFLLSVIESEYPQIEIENLLGEIACEKSIEAGDLLNNEEAKNLLKVWLETNNPNLCPHGRPIYYKIPVEEIRKKVGRI